MRYFSNHEILIGGESISGRSDSFSDWEVRAALSEQTGLPWRTARAGKQAQHDGDRDYKHEHLCYTGPGRGLNGCGSCSWGAGSASVKAWARAGLVMPPFTARFSPIIPAKMATSL